jgi:uncharacterized membrane protein YpjA
MLKRIGFGVVLWAVPYVTAIPLLPLMQSDLIFFKTIMIVEGSLLGGLLTAIYLTKVQANYLREGLLLAAIWITLNWLLDFAALLPFTHQTVPRYFMEIGLRYLAVAATTVAVGYVMQRRLRSG